MAGSLAGPPRFVQGEAWSRLGNAPYGQERAVGVCGAASAGYEPASDNLPWDVPYRSRGEPWAPLSSHPLLCPPSPPAQHLVCSRKGLIHLRPPSSALLRGLFAVREVFPLTGTVCQWGLQQAGP